MEERPIRHQTDPEYRQKLMERDDVKRTLTYITEHVLPKKCDVCNGKGKSPRHGTLCATCTGAGTTIDPLAVRLTELVTLTLAETAENEEFVVTPVAVATAMIYVEKRQKGQL